MAENEAEHLNPAEQLLRSQAETDPIVLPSNVTVYANNLGIGMTVFDIVVTFGEVVGVRDGRAVIQQRVKIIMSPLLAKIFTRNLSESVSDYEKQFGEIRVPEGFGSFVEKAIKS
jgi:Protein of unknown function (DUF3467)